ncbi:uncharacterized protein LOC144155489, partial [Haemaphysalis longicornis]
YLFLFLNVNRWHKERKIRVTCSKAHSILKTRKGPLELVEAVINAPYFTCAATKHETKMEPVARKAVEEKVFTAVVEAGLVVQQSQPWLCGSPDGLLQYQGSPCLLEIKCPHSRKDSKLIDATKEVSFLKYVKYIDGRLTLLKSHKYYTQSITLLIERDEVFISTAVRALEDFYFVWLVPALAMRHM